MSKAIFYHAGCSVCIAAEDGLAAALDPQRFDIERVHLGEQPDRLADAERVGVESVPALVIDGAVYHVNFGASLEQLKSA